MKTSTNKRFLLLSFFLLVTGSASAGWEKVGATDKAVMYIDPATLRREGNFRKIWLITEFQQRSENGTVSTRHRDEYDCGSERRRVLSMSTHTKSMAGGKTISSTSEPNGVWREIPPGTVANDVLEVVCAQ